MYKYTVHVEDRLWLFMRPGGNKVHGKICHLNFIDIVIIIIFWPLLPSHLIWWRDCSCTIVPINKTKDYCVVSIFTRPHLCNRKNILFHNKTKYNKIIKHKIKWNKTNKQKLQKTKQIKLNKIKLLRAQLQKNYNNYLFWPMITCWILNILIYQQYGKRFLHFWWTDIY